MMAPLRCCSFNCRCWNSGLVTLNACIDYFDLCFIEEHWLFKKHLHKLGDFFPNLFTVSVSGMEVPLYYRVVLVVVGQFYLGVLP